MKKTTQRYTRIDPDLVRGIRKLEMEELDKIRKLTQKELTARIFIGVAESIPAGSPVELELDLSDKGVLTADGIVEWVNDGVSHEDATGLGIQLFAIFRPDSAGDHPSGRKAAGISGEEDNEIRRPDSSTGETEIERESEEDGSIVPSSTAICDLFESLLDAKVSTGPGSAVVIDPETPLAAALFTLEDGTAKAIWLSSLETIVYVGSALAVVPPETAMATVKSAEIPDNIRENFQEVMNVSASLFNKAEGPFLKLDELFIHPEPVTEDIMMKVAGAANRVDLAIRIADYGEGTMSLIEIGN
ncbi:MAG: hypothetical protein JW814_01040 [Candidatus Krumholzibacteriota bacterium]|nr:hypothetical protein [Candidatus Krumholzibacteriota bacterium]